MWPTILATESVGEKLEGGRNPKNVSRESSMGSCDSFEIESDSSSLDDTIPGATTDSFKRRRFHVPADMSISRNAVSSIPMTVFGKRNFRNIRPAAIDTTEEPMDEELEIPQAPRNASRRELHFFPSTPRSAHDRRFF
mmetsp:Transcript_369/g.499  ORF Transcript_369/g.499 Transcript_369/m.499 type:complete len:138 (+) Transcript_369:81-494(+)